MSPIHLAIAVQSLVSIAPSCASVLVISSSSFITEFKFLVVVSLDFDSVCSVAHLQSANNNEQFNLNWM